jgi:hypothetical protein
VKGASAKGSVPATPAKPAAPAPEAVDPRLLRTKKMCELRAWRERDTSIRAVVSEVARIAARSAKAGVTAAEAWEREMPPALVAETWIEGASSALLMVGVPSAAVAFEVDRALRAGALAKIRAAMQAPGLRVRTRQGRNPGAPGIGRR